MQVSGARPVLRPEMSRSRPRGPLGRCSFLFLLALGFDVLGFILILVGIFASLELDGRSFGEFLIYGGGILLFFSLLWWLAWYSLNLEVSLEELMRDPHVSARRSSLAQLARKFSERFSKRRRRKAETITRNPSPITTCVFINSGFSSHLDTPTTAEKPLELSVNGHLPAGGVQGVEDRLV